MTDDQTWLHRQPELVVEGWPHGWTDDRGPDFKGGVDSPAQEAAVHELCRKVGMAGAAWAEQVHGGTVLKVESPGPAGRADGLWTDRPDLGVVGRSADCPLVLLAGRKTDGGRLAGFAHASWRSTVRGITGVLVGALTGAGAVPGSLRAVICPSAGPCCYEVGEEVRREALERLGTDAADHFTPAKDRWILDLWAANIRQLVEAGLSRDRIHLTGHCTICGGSGGDLRFASYRRQGPAAGRFAAILGVPVS